MLLCYHIIILILCCSSIILNTFVFIHSKRTQKGFYYLLLAINVIMLLLKYNIGLLVLFSFLILLPYRFTREKKSRIISIIATVLLLIYFIDSASITACGISNDDTTLTTIILVDMICTNSRCGYQS